MDNTTLLNAAHNAMTAANIHMVQTNIENEWVTAEGFWTGYEPYRVRQLITPRHEGIWDVLTKVLTPPGSHQEVALTRSLLSSNLPLASQLHLALTATQLEAVKKIQPNSFQTIDDMLTWTVKNFDLTREEALHYFQEWTAPNTES